MVVLKQIFIRTFIFLELIIYWLPSRRDFTFDQWLTWFCKPELKSSWRKLVPKVEELLFCFAKMVSRIGTGRSVGWDWMAGGRRRCPFPDWRGRCSRPFCKNWKCDLFSSSLKREQNMAKMKERERERKNCCLCICVREIERERERVGEVERERERCGRNKRSRIFFLDICTVKILRNGVHIAWSASFADFNISLSQKNSQVDN